MRMHKAFAAMDLIFQVQSEFCDFGLSDNSGAVHLCKYVNFYNYEIDLSNFYRQN